MKQQVLAMTGYFDKGKEDAPGAVLDRDGLGRSLGTSLRAGRDNMRKLAASKGLSIGREESFSPTTTDLKSQLTNLKNASVDAIFMHGVGTPSVVVYRNARELDLKIPLVSGHGQANSAFRKAVGDDVVGQPVVGAPVLVWKEMPVGPQRRASEEFSNKYSWGAAHAHVRSIEVKFTKPVPVGTLLRWTGKVKELHPIAPGKNFVVVELYMHDPVDHVMAVGSAEVMLPD
jgi:hypothetical protein